MRDATRPWLLAGWALVPAFALVLAACSGSKKAPAPTVTQPAASPTAVATGPTDPGSVAAAFDEQKAMDYVRTLSDPKFMGRHTGTPGELLGAQLLADEFKADGLQPAGDNGTYLQQFPVTVTEMTAPPVLAITGADGKERSLRLRDDFRPLVGGLGGPGDASGPAFFAGTGDLTGIDVHGKVVVAVPRRPLGDIVRDAMAGGATAVMFTTGEQPLIKGELSAFSGNTMPIELLSAQGFAALLEGTGHTRDELNSLLSSNQPLPTFAIPFNVRISTKAESKTVQAHNVVALLPAASPTQDTYIVGGHYEEIGPDPDGAVYPAANDNASGASVVLEIARLLSQKGIRPSANVLFIGWSGHEEGLLGSDYYLNHPAFPLANTKLYINLDTVGNGAGAALFAGLSDNDRSPTLQTALDDIKAVTGAAPAVQSQVEHQADSDHINFQHHNIPDFDFNWTGIEQNPIHTLADDASNVDPAKLKVTGEVATAVLLVALGGT